MKQVLTTDSYLFYLVVLHTSLFFYIPHISAFTLSLSLFEPSKPSILLQMAKFHSFGWSSSIPLQPTPYLI